MFLRAFREKMPRKCVKNEITLQKPHFSLYFLILFAKILAKEVQNYEQRKTFRNCAVDSVHCIHGRSLRPVVLYDEICIRHHQGRCRRLYQGHHDSNQEHAPFRKHFCRYLESHSLSPYLLHRYARSWGVMANLLDYPFHRFTCKTSSKRPLSKPRLACDWACFCRFILRFYRSS